MALSVRSFEPQLYRRSQKSQVMDIARMISELRADLKDINQAIVSLERLHRLRTITTERAARDTTTEIRTTRKPHRQGAVNRASSA